MGEGEGRDVAVDREAADKVSVGPIEGAIDGGADKVSMLAGPLQLEAVTNRHMAISRTGRFIGHILSPFLQLCSTVLFLRDWY
jgi:hypothetical protein